MQAFYIWSLPPIEKHFQVQCYCTSVTMHSIVAHLRCIGIIDIGIILRPTHSLGDRPLNRFSVLISLANAIGKLATKAANFVPFIVKCSFMVSCSLCVRMRGRGSFEFIAFSICNSAKCAFMANRMRMTVYGIF